MLNRWLARMVVWMLRSARFSNQERQILTAVLLERLGALPLRASIVVDETGKVFVGGKPLTLEKAQLLRETSQTMLKNFARKFVREQIVFMAIHKGVHENTTPEQGLFAKAALWALQEEEKLYAELAGAEGESD